MVEITALPAYQPRPKSAPLALEGIRVIDFTHFVAGPVCTVALADFGAQVIKVENAGRGDDLRSMRIAEINGEAGAFLWANRSKQSIGLNLSVAEGRAVALKLIAAADIVVENFSVGVMQRLGLDYATVKAANPRLIYCSISAYGQDSQMASRAGFDPVAQAEAGLMSCNGQPGTQPVVMGTPVVDITAGMAATNAILAALAARFQHGVGQYIDIALFDQAINMLGYHATNSLISGVNPVRGGNEAKEVVPVGVFETADGPFFLCCANDRTYQRLASEVLNRPDLAEHADYRSMKDRERNGETLMSLLRGIFLRDHRRNWLRKMHAAGVPAGAVASVTEAMDSDEVRERGLLSQLPHAVADAVPNIAPPYRLSATPVSDPRAAPALGQHTDEILKNFLGLEQSAIDMLAQSGALGAKRQQA